MYQFFQKIKHGVENSIMETISLHVNLGGLLDLRLVVVTLLLLGLTAPGDG